MWQILIAIWNLRVKEWHDTYFRESNNDRSKRGYKTEHMNAIDDFYDVNSTLNTVTNIYHMVELGFYWSYQCFCGENLALFMIASIHRIYKRYKNRKLGNKTKVNRKLKAAAAKLK